jgi:hypothetical protein
MKDIQGPLHGDKGKTIEGGGLPKGTSQPELRGLGGDSSPAAHVEGSNPLFYSTKKDIPSPSVRTHSVDTTLFDSGKPAKSPIFREGDNADANDKGVLIDSSPKITDNTLLNAHDDVAPRKVFALPSHDEVVESYQEWLDEREERLKGPPTDEEIIHRARSLKNGPLNVDEYMELEKVAQRLLAKELEKIENDPDMLADDKAIAREDAHFDYGGHIVPLQIRLGTMSLEPLPKPPRNVPEIPPDERPIYKAWAEEVEARKAEIDARKLPKSEKWLLQFGLLEGDELERRLEDHRTNRDFAALVWEHEAELDGQED